MSEVRQLLLEKLRAELAFIESGGYPNPVRARPVASAIYL